MALSQADVTDYVSSGWQSQVGGAGWLFFENLIFIPWSTENYRKL